MKSTLRADLRRLSALAVHRDEWGAALVRRLHRLRRLAKRRPDYPAVDALYKWLFVPLTLWPVYLEGLGWHVVERLETGRRLEPPMLLLLSLLGEPPDETAQAITTQHEHAIQSGDYGSLIHSQHKQTKASSADC
jgi:hypothetical protein